MNDSSGRNPIYVLGTDAEGMEHLAIHLQDLVLTAKRVAASKRLLKEFPKWWGENGEGKPIPELFDIGLTNELIKWLKKETSTTVLLASGDPLWFGIGRKLVENFSSKQLVFHPAPSSLQLAFSRIGKSWENTDWISLHGRDPTALARKLQQRPESLAILTDPNKGGAKEVLEILKGLGLELSYAFWIFEQLGHSNEKVWQLLPNNEIKDPLHPLHMVVLLQEAQPYEAGFSEIPLFGLEDGLFLQHKDRPGLMTKRENRIQLLADLQLPSEGVLWDLCAGVGSIGLEALRISPKLQVLLVERRGGGADIIKQNALRLEVEPKAIIEKEAFSFLKEDNLPESLANPNRIILGGGGEKRIHLLKLALERLTLGGIIVIPLATLEPINEIRNLFKKSGYSFAISQHQSYRGLPLSEGTRLSPVNPIFIIKGVRKIR
ncbi:precorrin-6y C5,15-methyltransferase (decarboxylating) subunit CbiE [Prochlorococcus sp. MIT 1341]|uniref:precorrin-6y C5,15-methyltransferase (decarboxylating) subunit CbiE n=1 Tax=Prochlorococcus sp. MIT 1341 TaxID=3096221 RepID=UPI002A76234E|nr:precorrin-6y C5,15-methyltransferase (decarboxylating) subunit CbiE [Prochlorococcus sp. MIT 1341]